MAAEIEAAERERAAIDRGWILAFIITLFAIHIGRMSTDWTLLGLLAPAVAVAGDMFVAVLITLLLINPAHLTWRGPTRWIERRVWGWYLGQAGTRSAWIARAAGAWLRWRMTMALRMRALRYSVPAALNQGLQRGLPAAAVIAATVPVWGMSWYFDTENWAAGIWNSWAESRTDTWREAMVSAVLRQEGGARGRRALPSIRRESVPATSRSSSSVTRARAMTLSTSFAINFSQSPTAPTCASSSCRPTSSTRLVRCGTTRRSSGCRSRA